METQKPTDEPLTNATAEKRKKPRRTFDESSVFTAAPVAAAHIGIPSATLLHCSTGTLCLNEHRITVSNRVFYFTAQVKLHAAMIAVRKKCDGRCKVAAEKVIAEAKQTIADFKRQPKEPSGK